MRQFGEMGVIKTTKKLKGKLTNRGIPVMYLGRAKDHAGDTYRFLNLETELVLISRDVIWLNKVYGDYKGTKESEAWETIGILPKIEKHVPDLKDEEEESQNVKQDSNAYAEQRPKYWNACRHGSEAKHTGLASVGSECK